MCNYVQANLFSLSVCVVVQSHSSNWCIQTVALLRQTKITILITKLLVIGITESADGAAFVFCLKFKFISFLRSLAVEGSVPHHLLSVSLVLL